jgi:hypothetical protein
MPRRRLPVEFIRDLPISQYKGAHCRIDQNRDATSGRPRTDRPGSRPEFSSATGSAPNTGCNRSRGWPLHAGHREANVTAGCQPSCDASAPTRMDAGRNRESHREIRMTGQFASRAPVPIRRDRRNLTPAPNRQKNSRPRPGESGGIQNKCQKKLM